MYTFKELGIKKEFLEVLKKQGIKTPTAIQEMCVEHIINNKDIIAEAPTGTGKTLAFLLPMMNNMKPTKNGIQGLIITPTRELAIQIYEEIGKINCNNLNTMAIYGGRDYSKQLEDAKGSLDLIVATPGRLADFMKKGLIQLNLLKTLVLDEVDQILLMGFQKEVESILKDANKKRQTLCFTATLGSPVKKVAYKITKDPLVISVATEKNDDKMKKYLVETTDRWKVDALATMLNKTNPYMAIIFCRTKARVDKVEGRLEEKGYNVQKLHSDVPQVKREKIIKSFKKGEIQYLVATDVASRGLDITGVTHIFNLDIPEKAETYIHRIGRTARAGEEGETYLFVDPKDRRLLGNIEELLGEKLIKEIYDGEKDVINTNTIYAKKYNKKIKSRTEERK
ncbi:MAG: DEAD/DEAH box helicase [Psychrilyobacter sp.]|nr:DEAD/DEAH box helicase [Psychrilyobacter sp.]